MTTNAIEIEGFQLSTQQSRVWALQRADHNDPAYEVRCAIVAEGSVNARSLKTALESVVKRHEILRTVFRNLPGVDTPLQVIVDGSVSWQEDHDLSELSPIEQERKLKALFRGGSSQTVDLENGPIVRASVASLSDGKHVLLVTMPALCADAATLKNLISEIRREIAPPLQRDELGTVLQYADFCEWQNEVTRDGETNLADKPWDVRDILDHPSEKLPFEISNPAGAGFESDFVNLKIGVF